MTVVTLIHGTWARGAEWTRNSSPLASALKERINGEVQIESFSWSGSNLHLARWRAAARLKKHLSRLTCQHINSKHFIIAHSHGGMVTLYALDDPEIRKTVSGTVCLATPFIQCRPRPLPRNTMQLLVTVLALAVFFSLLPRTPRSIPGPLLLIPAYIVALAVVFGIRALLSYVVLGHLRGKFDEIYKAVVASFSLPQLSSTELLVLRAPGDEASAALGASEFASWLFGRLSVFAQRVYRLGASLKELNDRLGRPTRICLALGGLCASCLLSRLAATWLIIPIFTLSIVGGCVLFSKEWGGYIQVAYMVVAIPLLLLCSLFSVAFGADCALLATFLEFSVDTTPIGTFSVISLKAPTARGLWHSLPYSDAEAFEAIVAWINVLTDR